MNDSSELQCINRSARQYAMYNLSYLVHQTVDFTLNLSYYNHRHKQKSPTITKSHTVHIHQFKMISDLLSFMCT